MIPQDLSIVFVVDGPALQAQGLLLAHSLARHAPRARRVAYVPDGAGVPLSPALAAAYADLGVDLRPMALPGGTWKKPFPHGNKILAVGMPRETRATLFLDTDMVAIRPLPLDGLIREAGIAAVPEGKPTWGKKNDRWDRVYAHFGMDLPTDRVRLTRGRRRVFYPYFNAGFIGFRDATGFAEAWLETAREIDWNVAVAQKRPWLDQVALPVTLKRKGLPYAILDEAWNYSISDRAPRGDAPLILHYHRFHFGRDWPEFREAVAALRTDLGHRLPADVLARFDAPAPGADAVRADG